MRLLIDIPKEFEQHFQADRFEDSLHRLRADVHLMAGLYEQETAEMLIDAFKNAVLVPPHGDLIDRRKLPLAYIDITDLPAGRCLPVYLQEDVDDAPTIIPVCEEVYDKYTDTAGNLHWTGTHSVKHIVKVEEGEK